jgi:excisionase family DNA binding protein
MITRRMNRSELEAAMADLPALLRIKEAAAFARVHERTIRRAIADGRLTASSVGSRSYLISKTALISFLTKGVA